MCSKKPNIYYLSGGNKTIQSMRPSIEGNIGIDQDMTGENTAGAALLDMVGSLFTVGGELVGDVANNIAKDYIQIPNYDEKQTEIMKDINDARNFAARFANDKQLQMALKGLVDTYLDALEELGEITEPAREQIMNEFFQAVSETTEEAAIGALNTGMNVAEAALGEIPVVGGAIDFGIAMARAFNNVMRPLSKAIESGSKVTGQSIDAAARAREVFERKQGELNKRFDDVQTAYNAFNNPMSTALKNPGKALRVGKMAGKMALARGGKNKKGKRKTKRKQKRKRKTKRKKAKRTINRIKRTIKRFTKKHRK